MDDGYNLAFEALQGDIVAMILHYTNILLLYCGGIIIVLTIIILFLLWQLLKKQEVVKDKKDGTCQ